MVGNTRVLWVSEPFVAGGRGFWAKLEGANPGGMKDCPAMHIVERACLGADLLPWVRIVESSSGALGLGLALAGMADRHPVTVVTDCSTEPIVQRMLSAYGAQVNVVSDARTRL